ncbi:hypothetical protein AB0E82_22710 [Streptomyces anulatus]|uniref:hypothetical protein n=1 Tax=Streptomyces anulatus TaxID=1892 RepID=UPI0033E516C7
MLHEDMPRPRHAGALADVLMSLLVHDPEARLDARTLDRELGGVSGELMEGAPVPGDGEVADAVPTSFRITAPEPGPRPSAPAPALLPLRRDLMDRLPGIISWVATCAVVAVAAWVFYDSFAWSWQ